MLEAIIIKTKQNKTKTIVIPLIKVVKSEYIFIDFEDWYL